MLRKRATETVFVVQGLGYPTLVSIYQPVYGRGDPAPTISLRILALPFYMSHNCLLNSKILPRFTIAAAQQVVLHPVPLLIQGRLGR